LAAIDAGYRAVYVSQSGFASDSDDNESPTNIINDPNYDHMVDRARITAAFIYELAFGKL
jgi:hypothetical protein